MPPALHRDSAGGQLRPRTSKTFRRRRPGTRSSTRLRQVATPSGTGPSTASTPSSPTARRLGSLPSARALGTPKPDRGWLPPTELAVDRRVAVLAVVWCQGGGSPRREFPPHGGGPRGRRRPGTCALEITY